MPPVSKRGLPDFCFFLGHLQSVTPAVQPGEMDRTLAQMRFISESINRPTNHVHKRVRSGVVRPDFASSDLFRSISFAGGRSNQRTFSPSSAETTSADHRKTNLTTLLDSKAKRGSLLRIFTNTTTSTPDPKQNNDDDQVKYPRCCTHCQRQRLCRSFHSPCLQDNHYYVPSSRTPTHHGW